MFNSPELRVDVAHHRFLVNIDFLNFPEHRKHALHEVLAEFLGDSGNEEFPDEDLGVEEFGAVEEDILLDEFKVAADDWKLLVLVEFGIVLGGRV